VITAKRLAAELAEARANVAALERTQALLNGAGRAVKIKRLGSVLDQAIEVDRARRVKARAGGTNGAGTHKYSDRVKHQRADTARALGIVAERGPLTAEAIVEATGVKRGWLGPMISRGYLAGKKGGTYKRTKKAFHVQPGAPA